MTTVSSIDLEALFAKAEEVGCVASSDVAALAETLELDDDQLNDVHAAIEARGYDINDDCARLPAEGNGSSGGVAVTNAELAVYTTDALQQFLNEAGRHQLLRPAEELELSKRIEMGDLQAKEKLTTHNLRLVVSIARKYQ